MGLVRMTKTQLRRIADSVRRSEATPLGRAGGRPIPVYTPQPDQVIAFELTEEMPEEHGPEDEYGAHVRDLDPTQHAGKGAYVTGTTDIVVRDTREVGYYGASGHKGACIVRYTSTGTRFGEICDMECP